MADDWEEETMAAPVVNGGASYYDGSGSGGYGGDGRGRGGVGGGRGRGRGGGGREDTCRKCGVEGHMSWECTSGGGGGRSTACFKCNEEGHMSRDCPNSGGGGGGGGSRACYKCNEEGHMSRDCPNGGGGDGGRGSRACYKCGEEGHMSRDCPSPGGGGGGGSSSRACFKCGEEGHMSRDCTSEGGGGGRPERPKGCFNCGEEGHIKADCTKPRDPAEELDSDGKPRPPLYVPEHITDEQLFCEGVQSGINFDAYESIPVSATGEGFIPPRLESFDDGGLRSLLVNNIKKAGYSCPTPIQRHCIPTIMAGRDIMGCAQTGSGKTAAFLLPILHKIIESGASGSSGMSSGGACPEAIVVAPTRELAIQIHNEARKFAMNSMVRVVVCYGGASTNSQYRTLQAGCSVLVATPGRLMDFLDKGRIDFSNIKFVVLDEADRMLDMGFINEIEKMMNHSTMPPLKDRQTLLFSATFPEEVQMMAGKYLNNYVFYVVGTVGAANTDVVQEVLNVPRNQKREMLVNKLKDFIALKGGNKILVFVETKRTADFLASYLSTQDLNSTSIHGDRFQSQREEALAQFKAGIRNILVATSVAARGLDIRGVSHVVNYDLPKEVDEYVHRIGRTGRVGNKGYALSFYDDENDGPIAKNLEKIFKDAKQEVPDWLVTAAASSGHSQTYHGVGNFAATDVRGQGGYYKEQSAQAFGGPAAAADEDEWD